MAQDKEFSIHIAGVKESVKQLESLEEALSSIEGKVKKINNEGGFSLADANSNKAMDELVKLTQKLAEYDAEYQKSVTAAKTALSEKNKEVKREVDLEKANLTVQENLQNTYAEKQRLLTAMGKVIRNTAGDTGDLKQRYAALNQELKDFDAELGNHQRNVGDYRGALKDAKMELKNLKGEMVGLEAYSKEWNDLARQAGALEDKIGDINQATKRYASDTKVLDDVINLAQSATAAFELYKGAMSAFGLETEGAEEAMQKLIGAMSIIQSLQQLSEALQSSTASAKALNLVMKVTGAELVTNQLAAIKATAAQQGLSTAQKAGAIASKTLGLALKAIPLMLVIGLVATLITHWDDLVGWFERTFPVLKKLGGAMNALKAVFAGVGKAIINWLVNPIKTFANVIQKVLQGDFQGAIKAAMDGVKNQFKGTADAFKEGFQNQVERGLESISKKTAAETAKQTKYELDMLKAKKGAEAKYSKEGIALQKKEFAERKKAAKGNAEELKQIALDEANFYRECQEHKTAAAKKSAAERAKANKEAADAAKKAAEEERKRREEEEKQRKAVIDANSSLLMQDIKTKKLVNKENQAGVKLELERYSTGPIERYISVYKKLMELKEEEIQLTAREGMMSVAYEMEKEFPQLIKVNEEGVANLTAMVNNMSDDSVSFYKNLTDVIGLEEVEAKKFMNYLTQFKNAALEGQNAYYEAEREMMKDFATARKNEISEMSSSVERIFKVYQEAIKKEDVTAVKKDNIWGKLFGVIDEKETLKKYDAIKKKFKETYDDITIYIGEEERKWDEYIEYIRKLYTKDSIQYRKAVQEKIDALEKLRKMQAEVGNVTNTPSSLSGDLNGDGKPDSPSGGTLSGAVQTELDEFTKFMTKLNDTLLEPMMDTFSMFMDFAIEETEMKLEQVEELHDKAIDKVSDSADKIAELNDRLRDSGNENMEATKKQMADEQMLYAQRLSEERRLAEEERNLKNKAAQQEAAARKMELRYNMVMAIANTAQGASKALSQWGWPLGGIFAGLVTALGATQVALIAKQIGQVKPVKYEDGGLLSGSLPSHSRGGVPVGNTGIEVEGGEMIVNKRDSARYLDVLQKINRNDPSVRYLQGSSKEFADTRIRKFANGGQLNFERVDANLQANLATNKLVGAIQDIDMHPIVSVRDIWKVEDRLVKVRSLAGHDS